MTKHNIKRYIFALVSLIFIAFISLPFITTKLHRFLNNRDHPINKRLDKFQDYEGLESNFVECLPLEAPNFGYLESCTIENFFSSVCSFNCLDGYEIRGSKCRTCQSNGKWSGYLTLCMEANSCPTKPPKMERNFKKHSLSVKKECCPPGHDGKRYNPEKFKCCHAGRLQWQTPSIFGSYSACDCCSENRNRCWTCCDEQISDEVAESDLKYFIKFENRVIANSTFGIAVPIMVDYESEPLSENDGFGITTKVVGGLPARESLRKSNVYLMYARRVWAREPIPGLPPVCGGVLIHRKWVLTARHCVIERLCKEKVVKPDMLVALLGKRYTDYTVRNDGQARQVDFAICHPHYCNNRRKPDLNDIALLRLSRDADLRDVIIASLPPQDSVPDTWRNCILTGWGISREVGVFPMPDYRRFIEEYRNVTPSELQEVEVPVVSNRRCVGRIRQCHLCAGSFMRDGCSSDSGSPLFCHSVDGSMTVYGVYNAGTCGIHRNIPSVYARTSFYRDWIYEVIEGYSFS